MKKAITNTTIHITIARDNGDGTPLEPLISGFMKLTGMTPKGDGTIDIAILAGARFHSGDKEIDAEILGIVRDFADEYLANPGDIDARGETEKPIPKAKLN